MSNERFFIALLPPEGLREEILAIKYHIRDNYQSSHSLNAPPHITLLSPFLSEEANTERIELLLNSLAKEYAPFNVKMEGYGAFEPRVLYINVNKDKALNNLQQKIEQLARDNEEEFNYRYQQRPYLPHLTLAFRDLSEDAFHEVWNEFKNKKYEAEFVADSFALLKHNGRAWDIQREFPLLSNEAPA